MRRRSGPLISFTATAVRAVILSIVFSGVSSSIRVGCISAHKRRSNASLCDSFGDSNLRRSLLLGGRASYTPVLIIFNCVIFRSKIIGSRARLTCFWGYKRPEVTTSSYLYANCLLAPRQNQTSTSRFAVYSRQASGLPSHAAGVMTISTSNCQLIRAVTVMFTHLKLAALVESVGQPFHWSHEHLVQFGQARRLRKKWLPRRRRVNVTFCSFD